jgi:hypothetical protein
MRARAEDSSKRNIRFGDIHDFKIAGGQDAANRFSRIASITVAGQVFGTPESLAGQDHYGFVAEQIGALSNGGKIFVLNTARNTDGRILGRTGDATLHEIGAAFPVSPSPTNSAKLANATTVTYDDADGDHVTVTLSKPLLSAGNVSSDDRCERGLISMVDQSIQKLPIARRSGNDDRVAEAFNNIGQRAGGHRSPQHMPVAHLYLLLPTTLCARRSFFRFGDELNCRFDRCCTAHGPLAWAWVGDFQQVRT